MVMLPSAVGGNFDVVAPDQRGYGQTTPMASAGSEGREGGDWRAYAHGGDGDDLVDVCALSRVADLASLVSDQPSCVLRAACNVCVFMCVRLYTPVRACPWIGNNY